MPVVMPTALDGVLKTRLVEKLASREHPKTLCPSEVARSLSADELHRCNVLEWREIMDPLRKIVYDMREAGELEVLQRGEVLGSEVGQGHVKGPIRIRYKKEQL